MSELKCNAKYIPHQSRENIFLATTSLEQFWDISKPIIFLGEWCRRPSRKKYWAKLDGGVLPHVWNNQAKCDEAFDYTKKVYERTLPLIADSLNIIHNKKYSERYWRIVIGPWLMHYIDIIYERYVSLRSALNQYPNFKTIGLTEESFITPNNTFDFLKLVEEDSYNLQIYTRILAALGIVFLKKYLQIESKTINNQTIIYSWKERLLSLLKKLMNLIIRVNFLKYYNEYSYLITSYFTVEDEAKIFYKTAGKVWPYYREFIEIYNLPFSIDYRLRTNILKLSFHENEFEKLIFNLLPLDIPLSFVEGYESLDQKAAISYPSNPKAIISAASWYTDEIFKLWSAKSSEKSTLLAVVQHGGGYGSFKNMRSAEHELAFSDIFYSWGWDQSDVKTNIIPMPATKFIGRPRLFDVDNKNADILFVQTCMTRYLFRIQHVGDIDFKNYFDWQLKFISSLLPAFQKKLRLRLYQSDFGWDLVDLWREFCPEVVQEGWDIPFMESLANCRLFLCDNCSTTYLESLSANKPSILFWNSELFPMQKGAIPYYDELRSIGILYDNPESAATAVNHIYNNVNAWWHKPERQRVIKRFCNRFAKTSQTAREDWIHELIRLSKAPTQRDKRAGY